jgi:hypothetical protein
MANKIELKLNNDTLELTNDKYEESYKNVDSLNVSEAGTNLRAVIRTAIPTLSISYICDATEKKKLDGFARASSLLAQKWDEYSDAVDSWACFMDGYTANLIVETPTTRFYNINFKLIDLES